jgi:hypothetical protein
MSLGCDCERMSLSVESSDRKSPKGPTCLMSSTPSSSSVTGTPPTACFTMRANSLSMTSCPKSNATPDSIIPAP